MQQVFPRQQLQALGHAAVLELGVRKYQRRDLALPKRFLEVWVRFLVVEPKEVLERSPNDGLVDGNADLVVCDGLRVAEPTQQRTHVTNTRRSASAARTTVI